MYQKEQSGNDMILYIDREELCLADTLDCGQAFRFERIENGITGIAHNRIITALQQEGKIIFKDMCISEFEEIWQDYFDLNEDYECLKEQYRSDETLKQAIAYCGGIRILRQESFEALISFLISQNNNIPRIKGSIKKLSARFGKKILGEVYAFPTIDELAAGSLSDFADLGLGYRDSYLYEAAQAAKQGKIDFDAIKTMEISQARDALQRLKGVGPKVAECVLLFGFHKTQAFPVDTWIKKVLAEYYPKGFPEGFQQTAGIAQQYLFHYMRTGR